MANVDANDTRAYLGKYNVRGTPTFVLFDARGHAVKSFSGWPGSQAIALTFDQTLAQQ